jgi:hypothetical protein
MLVHGEASALEERQSCLRETGWQAVDVPISGNRYVFRTASPIQPVSQPSGTQK